MNQFYKQFELGLFWKKQIQPRFRRKKKNLFIFISLANKSKLSTSLDFNIRHVKLTYNNVFMKWIQVNSTDKISDSLYKRSKVQSPLAPKSNWCLGLIIKNYHQEWSL